MSRQFHFICAASALSLLSACGGGGGGGSTPRDPPGSGAPTVSLAASATSVTIGQAVTLTWSSTNATSCVAGGDWSGARATSGSEQISALEHDATFTLTCSGAGGSANRQVAVTVKQPAPTEVVLRGRITFDRPQFAASPAGGLDLANPVVSPARRILVEAVAAGGAVLASTETDGDGKFAMVAPANQQLFVQAKARMRKAGSGGPTWDFQVLNNANKDALYALISSEFNSGAKDQTIELHASTGWTGTNYGDTRAAAPFAILDSALHAVDLILTAKPDTQFAPLNFFWSNRNRPAGPFCPDEGNIGTTSYVVFSTARPNDSCGQPGTTGIYVLGEFSAIGDTDEFDPHVIIHELGHYFEHRFSRSDSLGGEHGLDERLDLRLAFGEGWGNAFAGMALGDPVYRDSFVGVSQSFSFNMESDSSVQPKGWFSEGSVARFLWDVFDPANEPGDQLAAGFGPIFAVMTGPQRQTEAYTSIFSFARALRSISGVSSSAVSALLASEAINGTGDFGEGETNAGGFAGALPIFEPIAVGELKPFCIQSTTAAGELNKLGNRKFFRFDALGGDVTIQVIGVASDTGPAAVDPDILVVRRGEIRAFGFSPEAGRETMSQVPLQAGTHIIEIIDSDLAGKAGARCMTLSISGG